MKPYYQDDAVTIYHGDCREIVPTLGRFDLLLTDPPYLLPGMKGAGCFGGRASLVGTQGFTDMGFDSAILNAFDNWFCFCSRHNLREILERAATGRWALLHWCKPNPVPTRNNTYLSDVEYCVHRWTKGRLFGEMEDKSLFMVYPCGNKETTHPNEKPLRLVGKLVTLGTQPGETILDPFAGSGTTGRAAKDLGRKAVLIEREERYCEIAARRMGQGVLDFCTANVAHEQRRFRGVMGAPISDRSRHAAEPPYARWACWPNSCSRLLFASRSEREVKLEAYEWENQEEQVRMPGSPEAWFPLRQNPRGIHYRNQGEGSKTQQHIQDVKRGEKVQLLLIPPEQQPRRVDQKKNDWATERDQGKGRGSQEERADHPAASSELSTKPTRIPV